MSLKVIRDAVLEQEVVGIVKEINSPRVAFSQIWSKNADRWLQRLYQEAPIEPQ